MQMMAQFAEFKKTMQGKNPEDIVKQMLANACKWPNVSGSV